MDSKALRFTLGAIIGLLLTVTSPTAGGPPTGATTQPAHVAPTSQPTTAPAQPVKPKDQLFGLTSKTMTGDWFGLGPLTRDLGINMSFYLQDHFMSVLGGDNYPRWKQKIFAAPLNVQHGYGVLPGSYNKDRARYDRYMNRGVTKNSYTLDWFLTLDLGKMGLIKDADILFHGRAGCGYSINKYAGTTGAQDPNDDADGRRSLYVDQLWYRQWFLDRKIALQFGQMDYQTVVDKNAYANSEDKQFMNTGLDNNPLVPTAAITTIGTALTIQPVPWYSLILAAADAEQPPPAAPNPPYKSGFATAFHDHEWFMGWIENDFSFKIPTAMGLLPGNYRFGLSYDPRVGFIDGFAFGRVIAKTTAPTRWDGHDYGFYMSLDQMLFRENKKDEQGLGTFFRYAYRNDDYNRFNQFWSTGLSYTGPFPTRDADVFGFGIAQLMTGDQYKNNVNRYSGEETVYEWYYAIAVTPWLVITPDLQYIDNPNATYVDNRGVLGTVSHSIVGGVRFRITF